MGLKKTIKLRSTAFGQMGAIPDKYTCVSINVNPPLEIIGIPDGTESLALIVDDPDAPGGVFDHWVVYNISPYTNFIEECSCPDGAIEGFNGMGKIGYTGPCPPSGKHRYFFKIYAIDKKIEEKSLTKKELIEKIEDHVIDHAELVGVFSK